MPRRASAAPTKLALRVNDLLFLNEYMANGRNGTKAYQTVHPKTSYSVAMSRAYQVLQKPSVQGELASRVQYEGGVTKEFVESSLLKYQTWAETAHDYVAGASICMDAAKVAGLITEKREVKTITDEESSAIRSLVRASLRIPPGSILATSAPTSVPVSIEPTETN